MLPTRTTTPIRVVDLATKETATLQIEGLRPPATTATPDTTDDCGPNPDEIKIAPQRLRAGIDGSLVINVDLPAGYHLNPSGASTISRRFRSRDEWR